MAGCLKSYAIFREHSDKSSDDGVEETLLSIPNRKVKLYSVDGTAREAVWESRTLLGENKRRKRLKIYLKSFLLYR